MPLYFYTAKDAQGQTKTDKLEAPSEAELASILKGQGLYLVKAKAQGEKQEGKIYF